MVERRFSNPKAVSSILTGSTILCGSLVQLDRAPAFEAGSRGFTGINKIMKYDRHYETLISRARNRAPNPDEYYETHHVIPRCLGGTDESKNLVQLTPEEHYTAHLLLIRIYPDSDSLVFAASMMTVSMNGKRNNKLYGWLRRKMQKVAKQRTGAKNNSYGKPWYYDSSTLINGKFIPGTEPMGWIKGRCPPFSTRCVHCDNRTNSSKAKWCNDCRPKKEIEVLKSPRIKKNYTDAEKLEALATNDWNIRRALYSLGLSDGGGHYKKMQQLKSCVSMPPDFESGES